MSRLYGVLHDVGVGGTARDKSSNFQLNPTTVFFHIVAVLDKLLTEENNF